MTYLIFFVATCAATSLWAGRDDCEPLAYYTPSVCAQLGLAASHGQAQECEKLISEGADVNYEAIIGAGLPLDQAITSGSVETYKLLREHRARHSSNFFFEDLFRYDHVDLCRFLLDEQVIKLDQTMKNTCNRDHIKPGSYGECAKPLHIAATHGAAGICELLCERGASIHATNELNETPLHVAIEHLHENSWDHKVHSRRCRTTRTLLDFGAIATQQDTTELKRFFTFSSALFIRTLAMLIHDRQSLWGWGGDVSMAMLTQGNRNMILRYAATHCKYDRIKSLLALGASPFSECPQVPKKYACTIDIIRHRVENSPTDEEREKYLKVLHILHDQTDNEKILERHYKLRPDSNSVFPDDVTLLVMQYDTSGSLIRALLPYT